MQTLEARPQAVGTDVRPYAGDADDAMHVSDYLVIGEVRDGMAA